jgi:uncharacterized delta-60 repeat protein
MAGSHAARMVLSRDGSMPYGEETSEFTRTERRDVGFHVRGIMNTRWLAIGLFASVVGVGPAVAATLDSVRTWGGTGSDRVEGTAVAADGSVYLAGTTSSFGAVDDDVFLIKYGPTGTLAWQRTWAQPAQQAFSMNDSASGVAVDSSGAAYVVGNTFTGLSTGNDLLLLKFNPDGTLAWQRTWGGISLDSGDAIVVGADGGIYVAGTTQSFVDREAFIVKFNSVGAVEWEQTWSRGESDSAQALAIGPNGNVYVAGTSFRPDSIFFFDAFLLQLTPGGNVVSETGYAAGEIADALGVAVAADGSVYLVGSLDGAAAAFVVRLTADLALDWDRTIGGRSGERANAVRVAADGTIWVVGETNTVDASDEVFVAQFSTRGRVEQQHTWGGVDIEHGIDLGFGPDGVVLNVGAIAQTPPWVFQNSRLKASRLRGTLVDLGGAVTAVTGTVGTPTGVVATPVGSETYGGESDAALLKIIP